MPVCLKTYVLLILTDNIMRAWLYLLSTFFYIFIRRSYGPSERDWYSEAGSGLLVLSTFVVQGIYSELHLA